VTDWFSRLNFYGIKTRKRPSKKKFQIQYLLHIKVVKRFKIKVRHIGCKDLTSDCKD